jgi:hypothetical protein
MATGSAGVDIRPSWNQASVGEEDGSSLETQTWVEVRWEQQAGRLDHLGIEVIPCPARWGEKYAWRKGAQEELGQEEGYLGKGCLSVNERSENGMAYKL